MKDFVGGEPSVGLAVRDFSWGSLRNSFHRLKRRINPHQSNRSRATNNLVHKSVVGKILSMSELVTPEMGIEAVEDDPDDDKILECAVAGNADYIVFDDSHLLDIEEYRGVEILSPDEFLGTRNS